MTFKHLCIAGVSVACLLSSCVDDKYDLSDIDTTVRVDIDDLTIPVNLDNIELNTIITEGERVKIVNGQYAVVQDGTFNSSAVTIGDFVIKSQPFNPTVVDIPFIPGVVGMADAGYYDINCPAQQFKFDASGVPAEITAIDDFGGNLMFEFDFNFQGIASIVRKAEISGLVLQLPKGLNVITADGDSYDNVSGIMNLSPRTLTGDRLKLVINADKADFKQLGAKFDYDSHTLSISGDFYVRAARIKISRNDIIAGASPANLRLTIGYNIPDFRLTTFSGRVRYNITGVDISDVNLTDLPDVLGQPGTDIRLANPQIYLSVTNPLQPYRLFARTGLTISSVHGDVRTPYSIDDPYFTIGNGNADGIYKFCLSPADPAVKIDGFGDALHVPFTNLSKVLSGNGMPSSLAIKLDNPCLPDQPVKDLRLGTDLGKIDGRYSFLAPIALEQGSKIVYADDIDGWSSEDLDHVTITKLDVKATLTSDIPLDLDITAYPIDKDGNRINNVEIKGAKITSSPNPQDVTITITGTVRNLDGIHYEAVATAGAGNQVLRPDMNIKVANLRPTASGYYEKEL